MAKNANPNVENQKQQKQQQKQRKSSNSRSTKAAAAHTKKGVIDTAKPAAQKPLYATDFDEGRFAKALDLGPVGTELKAVIDRYTIESLDDGQGGTKDKLCLWLRGRPKGVIMNKTNRSVLSEAYSADVNQWVGKPVIMFVDKDNFRGKLVPCLRLKV